MAEPATQIGSDAKEQNVRNDYNASLPSTVVSDVAIVDWDGNSDPQCPLNWSAMRRMAIVLNIGGLTFVGNLATTMIAPGLRDIEEDFELHGHLLSTLVVTVFLLGLAIGPLVIPPLSEVYGRALFYHITNGVLFLSMIGCALSKNLAMLVVFRAVGGLAAAVPPTVGGGVVADITPLHQRGRVMSLYMAVPLTGLALGPIIGGAWVQSHGWRGIFWILCIITGIASVSFTLVYRETYGLVLLKRRADMLNKAADQPKYRAKGDAGSTMGLSLKQAIRRPITLLFTSPVVSIMSLYLAFVFGLVFLLLTTFPMVFEQQYHFSKRAGGLSYVGVVLGMLVGLATFGTISDAIAAKMQRQNHNLPRPEHRLPPMVWFAPTIPIGFFWYGWSAQAKLHWIMPMIGTSIFGFGCLFVSMPIQTYLVDAYGPNFAASALGAIAVLRSLAGAFLPLAGPPLYKTLGLGWGNSVLAFIAIAFSFVPLLLYKWRRSDV